MKGISVANGRLEDSHLIKHTHGHHGNHGNHNMKTSVMENSSPEKSLIEIKPETPARPGNGRRFPLAGEAACSRPSGRTSCDGAAFNHTDELQRFTTRTCGGSTSTWGLFLGFGVIPSAGVLPCCSTGIQEWKVELETSAGPTFPSPNPHELIRLCPGGKAAGLLGHGKSPTVKRTWGFRASSLHKFAKDTVPCASLCWIRPASIQPSLDNPPTPTPHVSEQTCILWGD